MHLLPRPEPGRRGFLTKATAMTCRRIAPCCPARRRTRRGGFTLIEVLTVVIIAGIAAAFVVPSLLSAGTMNLQGASRLIMADLMYAQNEAAAAAAPRSIVFQPASNSYRLVDENGATISLEWMRTGGDASAAAAADQHTVDFDSDDRFTGIRITGAGTNPVASLPTTPFTVTFDATGGPTPATVPTAGRVRLEQGGNTAVVTIAPFTGRLTVDVQRN